MSKSVYLRDAGRRLLSTDGKPCTRCPAEQGFRLQQVAGTRTAISVSMITSPAITLSGDRHMSDAQAQLASPVRVTSPDPR